MSYVFIDIEADGPYSPEYSMISFGAVIVGKDKNLDQAFYGQLSPISQKHIPDALAVSGHSREETFMFPHPKNTMDNFVEWLNENVEGRPMFVSDNNGFDWCFMNYYLHRYTGGNPFGYSSTNLGSLYKGCEKNLFKNFKHLRKTKHTHHPVDDAKGNAEAFLQMIEIYDLKLKL
jgi:DNA polymerase III alpha subunit (gram-positive type)